MRRSPFREALASAAAGALGLARSLGRPATRAAQQHYEPEASGTLEKLDDSPPAAGRADPAAGVGVDPGRRGVGPTSSAKKRAANLFAGQGGAGSSDAVPTSLSFGVTPRTVPLPARARGPPDWRTMPSQEEATAYLMGIDALAVAPRADHEEMGEISPVAEVACIWRSTAEELLHGQPLKECQAKMLAARLRRRDASMLSMTCQARTRRAAPLTRLMPSASCKQRNTGRRWRRHS